MKTHITEASPEPLLSYFDRIIPLKQGEKELVRAKFHARLFRKRQFVLQEGDVCTQLNFIVRGFLRLYKIDEKGNIHILQFAAENNWINDLGSFHQVRPSALNIDALEDTVVLQISREDLIRDNGFVPVRIGGIDKSIRIEVFGDLHEFGALGKPVTLGEAKQVMETA